MPKLPNGFSKALKAVHNQEPRVINLDKNAAYSKAIDELKAKKSCPSRWSYDRISIWTIESNKTIDLLKISHTRDRIWVIQHGKANNKGLRIMNHPRSNEKSRKGR